MLPSDPDWRCFASHLAAFCARDVLLLVCGALWAQDSMRKCQMQFLSPGPAASCVFVSAVAEEECKSSPNPSVEAYLNVKAEIDNVRGRSCLRIPGPPPEITGLCGGYSCPPRQGAPSLQCLFLRHTARVQSERLTNSEHASTPINVPKSANQT